MLLEALKKAAEDKKKALDNSEQPSKKAIDSSSNSELTATQDVMSDVVQKQTTSFPATSTSPDKKNQRSSDVDGEAREKQSLSSLAVTENDTSQSSLKLTLENPSIQKSSSTNIDTSSSSSKKSTNEAQSKLKLVLEEAPIEQNVKDDSFDKANAQVTSPTVNVESMTDASGSVEAFDSDVVNVKEHESAQEYEAAEILKNKNEAEYQVVKEADGELPLSKQKIDSEDFMKPVGDISSEYVNNVLAGDTVPLAGGGAKEETIGTAVEKPQNDKEVVSTSMLASEMKPEKTKLEDESESFKWSLDSLPGYLKVGKGGSKKSSAALNPILVSGALSDDPRRSSRQSSPKLILILLMILAFIGIVFYGILYYQTEYESVENSMKKYNLVKTDISEKEIANTTISIDESVEKVASNLSASAKQTEGVYLEDALDGKKTVDVIKLQDDESKEGVKPLNEARTSLPEEEGTVESTPSNSKVIRPVRKNSDFIASVTSTQKHTENNVHNKATVVVHTEKDVLSEAYLSYEQGNYVAAQQAFEAVLKINPSNELALIGLGNVAVIEQHYLDAMALYQQALLTQPSSLNAFEAIANIAGFVELNEEWKASLLGMAQDYPESATLQYALGNLYAGEQDWLAAQKSYFQAVSLEPDNANYIMNLAVSLDQLGKYKLAAQHYTEALSFVDIQAVNFDEAQVKNRLISIKQFIAEKNL